jgi:AraC-like DNA-binding protein
VIACVDFGCGIEGLRRQRAETRDVCDVEPLGPVADFRADCEVARVGPTVFILSRTSSVAYLRKPIHVARGGDDHYQLQLQLDGMRRGDVGPLEIGDMGIHDMGRPSVTELHATIDHPSRVLAWLVPRVLLAPMLADPEAVRDLRLSASAPYAKLLAEQMWSLWTHGPACTSAEAQTLVYALLQVFVGGLGFAPDVSDPSAARLMEVKRYVEREIASPTLSAEAVAAELGVSRASLYRLLAIEGGFASYVRRRRLHRAARQLTSPAHRHLRILDIALDSRFADETSFSRAFRREFGLSPGDLRASIDRHGIVRTAAGDALGWLRQLGLDGAASDA